MPFNASQDLRLQPRQMHPLTRTLNKKLFLTVGLAFYRGEGIFQQYESKAGKYRRSNLPLTPVNIRTQPEVCQCVVFARPRVACSMAPIFCVENSVALPTGRGFLRVWLKQRTEDRGDLSQVITWNHAPQGSIEYTADLNIRQTECYRTKAYEILATGYY